jgi:hypothetical protein
VSRDEDEPPTPPGAAPATAPAAAPGAAPAAAPALRPLVVAALAAVALHVLVRALLAHQGSFFASEDDPYRAYLAYLLRFRDGEGLVGRFWLPLGHVVFGAAQLLGLSAAWAGPVVNTLATGLLVLGAAGLAADLAPPPHRRAAAWASVTLVAASPMTIRLAQSALADLLCGACVVCACAGLVRGARRRRLLPLLGGSLALLAATGLRYEAWLLVPLFPVAALALARRDRAPRPRLAATALCGLLPLLGPAAWMLAQHATHGDALLFWRWSSALARDLGGASRAGLLLDRLLALLLWAPAVVGWALCAAPQARRDRALRGALVIAATLALVAVLPAIVTGHDHPVFPARLAYLAELGLVPLAAAGLAAVVLRADVRPALRIAALGLGVALGALPLLRPAAMWDDDAVALGLALRRGQLQLPAGALLVERPVRRPPFGWASVGVLWGRWEQTVFATPDAGGWKLVEPSDVVRGRAVVAAADLGAWLDRRGVAAAWMVSREGAHAVRRAWPDAAALPRGKGLLLLRRAPPATTQPARPAGPAGGS